MDHAYEVKLTASGHRSQVIEGAATTTYGYDALYRLTGETVVGGDANRPNRTLSYTLDKVGNRLSRTSDLAAIPTRTGLTYNSRDWLGTDTYDSKGNTTTGIILESRSSLPASSTSGTDVYDFQNQLIERQKPDGTSLTLAYDADGIRIGKTLFDTGGAITRSTSYLVDTNNLTGYAQVFEETTTGSSATTTKVTTYGTSLLRYAETSAGSTTQTTRYFLTDGGGSVRELADETGAITDRYDYDAFGDLTATSGSTDNAYLYRGEQYDADLGLYYLRARYMNPDSGRFWNADAYEGGNADPISLHRYLYASGDPVLGRDPSGNFTLVEMAATLAVTSTVTMIALPVVRPVVAKVVGYLGGNPNARYSLSSIGVYDESVQLLEALGISPDDFSRNLLSDAFTELGADTIAGAIGGVAGGYFAKGLAAFRQATPAEFTPPSSGAGQDLGGASAAEMQGLRNNADLVQDVAKRADSWGTRQGLGVGPRAGTLKHGYADRLLTRYQSLYGDRGLSTEVSYLNGQAGVSGRGSIRLDVVEGALDNPTAIYDYKFGGATLTPERIFQIRQVGGFGLNVPITDVHP